MPKDPYVSKMEAELNEWKAKLDALKGRAAKASAEARSEVQKKVEAFEARYADVSRRFDDLRAAGAGSGPRRKWKKRSSRSATLLAWRRASSAPRSAPRSAK